MAKLSTLKRRFGHLAFLSNVKIQRPSSPRDTQATNIRVFANQTTNPHVTVVFSEATSPKIIQESPSQDIRRVLISPQFCFNNVHCLHYLLCNFLIDVYLVIPKINLIIKYIIIIIIIYSKIHRFSSTIVNK